MATRRIRCRACGAASHEPISFCPDPYVRYTKWTGRFVLGLRKAMSISDVARFTGLHRETVKNIEKAWLEKKYKKVRLDDVACLGIDEVHLGSKLGYIIVIRDLDSGAVLFIGKGKGGLEDLRPTQSVDEEKAVRTHFREEVENKVNLINLIFFTKVCPYFGVRHVSLHEALGLGFT